MSRQTTHKFGSVILKDWMLNPKTGHQVLAVVGPLELLTAKESWGFQPKGNETNWAVRVGSDADGVLILGCQIRGIYWGENQFQGTTSNVWNLV